MSTKIQRWSEVKGPVSKGRNRACVILSITWGEQAIKSICLDPLMFVGGGVSDWKIEWALYKLCWERNVDHLELADSASLASIKSMTSWS